MFTVACLLKLIVIFGFYFTSSNVICIDIQHYTNTCCKYDTIKKAIKIKHINLYINHLQPFQ